jgi:ParB family chromosome partitioning protein
MRIPLDQIVPNPQQPRKVFDPDEMENLVKSLITDGLLNPIAVEGPAEGGIYTILDGERRWRAAKMAGWKDIEVHVRQAETDDQGRMILALVGNLQRADMGPIDEALAYRKLQESGLTLVEIAQRIGRSEGAVNSRLALLKFPPSVQILFNLKKLPMDMRVIASLRDLTWNDQESVAKAAAKQKLSSSQIIGVCKRIQKPKVKRSTRPDVARSKIADSTCPPISLYPVKPVELVPAFQQTCRGCGLYVDGGVRTICPTCPMISFAKILSETKVR